MRSTEPVEHLIASMKAKPSPELDARVHRAIDAAVAERSGEMSVSHKSLLGTILMKSTGIKWAAAAAIILVLVAAIVIFDKSTPQAFGLERVIAAYNSVRSLHVKDYQHDQVANEFWIVSDGQEHVAKARYFLPETEDGAKLIAWTPAGSEIWFKNKRRYLAFQTKRIAPWMQHLLDLSQPELALKKVLDAQKSGKVTIRTEQTGGLQPFVKFTATYKGQPRVDVAYVDPSTVLVTRLESYRAQNGTNALQWRMDFSDYNQPLDDKLFSLRSELPKDVRIADQLTQVSGVAQGSLTDEQAATETVRQFFQALVDKDYKKAGLIVCGEVEADARKEYGVLTVTAVQSVGPPVLQTNWDKRGYMVPCAVEVVHADGQKTTWKTDAYVRPGDDEMHPNNWNITGGVNMYETDLKILPDNAKYEAMSPKEAAAAFFQACADKNRDEAMKFWYAPSDTNSVKRLMKYVGGLQLISLGEPFQTNTYAGWYVPYEIQLPPFDYLVRVDNTNQAHRYVVTGTYDTDLQLEHDMAWTSQPAILPDNDRYAAMSPAQVVQAWAAANARYDLEALAKFVPQSEVAQAQRTLALAKQRGIDLTQGVRHPGRRGLSGPRWLGLVCQRPRHFRPQEVEPGHPQRQPRPPVPL
jgi:hypothetical protein